MANVLGPYLVRPSAVQYNNYVCSFNLGPQSTSQTPGQIPYHSKGVLIGPKQNPPQFSPSDGASEFSNARHQYANTATSVKQQYLARQKVLAENNTFKVFSPSSQREYATSSHMNYIAPISSSERIRALKANAVGKKSANFNGGPYGYKNVENKSEIRTATRRARSGGCIAPAKKGSIFNRTCTAGGGICNIGAIANQDY
jgi:hypothetical protein